MSKPSLATFLAAVVLMATACGGGGGDPATPPIVGGPADTGGTPVAGTPPPATGTVGKGGHRAIAIQAVYFGALAIRDNGDLWGWGYNNCTLALGDKEPRTTPVRIGTGFAAFGDTYDMFDVLAIQSNGDLYAWGQGGAYSLGVGNATEVCTPTKILSGVKKAAASNSAGAAVMRDGTVYRWGHRYQNAAGTFVTAMSPLLHDAIGGGWIDVAGDDDILALVRIDGTLWTAGYGSILLGIGSTSTVGTLSNPVLNQIGSDTNWSAVYYNPSAFFASKTNGELYGWGNGSSFFTLGDGTDARQASPVLIMAAGAAIVKVISRGDTTIAIRADGSVWGWGDNISRKFGDGTDVDSALPRLVQTDTKDLSFPTSSVLGVSIRSNLDIWAWGQNQPDRFNQMNCRSCDLRGNGTASLHDPQVTDSFVP